MGTPQTAKVGREPYMILNGGLRLLRRLDGGAILGMGSYPYPSKDRPRARLWRPSHEAPSFGPGHQAGRRINRPADKHGSDVGPTPSFSPRAASILLTRLGATIRPRQNFPEARVPAARRTPMKLRKIYTVIIAGLAMLLTFSLVLYPEKALAAAVDGMNLFFRVVFPSLLPFFILSEIMLGLGVVHFIGVLFEPLMRPVFNVPGEGAFALSMGLAAGYPMDAVITAKFRRADMCTRVEGERLLAFTNTADPLFIFGAVAVGMFGMEKLGGTLALAHYLGALTVGLLFRFYRSGEPSTVEAKKEQKGNMLVRAIRRLIQARREDGRPLGRLVGDAVNDSVRSLLMIGGFIMLFSVIVKVISVIGIGSVISAPFVLAFRILGVDRDLVPAALNGLFEIDLGAVASSTAQAPFAQKAAMASAIIAWSGLSVHGQVASVVSGTDIRMGPYAFARFLHAVVSSVLTLWFLGSGPVPAAAHALNNFGPLPFLASGVPDFWSRLELATKWALMIPTGMVFIGSLAGLLGGIGGFTITGFSVRRPRE